MSIKDTLTNLWDEVEAFFESTAKADIATAAPILETTAATLGEDELTALVSGDAKDAGPIAAKVLTAAAPQLTGIAVNSAMVAMSNVTAKLKAAAPAS